MLNKNTEVVDTRKEALKKVKEEVKGCSERVGGG